MRAALLLPMLLLAALPAAAAPRQLVDIAGAQVTFTPAVAAVERPLRVPLRISATASPAVERGGARVVDVAVCASWRCAVRHTVHVVVGGAPVDVEAPVGPDGIHARLSAAGEERTCCSPTVRAAHVVATLEPGARVRAIQLAPQEKTNAMGGRDVVDGGVSEIPVTAEILVAHPGLLDGFSALIVDGPLDPRLAPAVAAWVARGGVVTRPSLPGGRGADPSSSTSAVEAAPAAALDDGAPLTLTVPEGTVAAPAGAGLVVRLAPGADADGALASVLAARPSLWSWPQMLDVDGLPAVHTAAVALAVAPPRGAAFALALAGLLAVVVVLVRGRRRSAWRAVLLRAAAVAVATCAALWVLKIATVPREARARVVTWTGPDASWETGVDAARPRSNAVTEVHGAAPLVAVTLVGETSGSHAELRAPAGSLDDTRAAMEVRSDAGLVGVWSRPSPRPGAVQLSGDVVKDGLEEPLDAVLLDGPWRFARGVPAHGAKATAVIESGVPYSGAFTALPVPEQRLVREIVAGCERDRDAGAPAEPPSHACGAAVARRADGALLGVELRAQPARGAP